MGKGNKDSHYIMIKKSIFQKDVIIVNIGGPIYYISMVMTFSTKAKILLGFISLSENRY